MLSYYEYDMDDEHVIEDRTGDELWPFFRRVAAELAMSDCSGVRITRIVYNGVDYVYAGWRPGMEYTFVNKHNPDAESYTTWMEHLDH